MGRPMRPKDRLDLQYRSINSASRPDVVSHFNEVLQGQGDLGVQLGDPVHSPCFCIE